jgi:hypothetical protein
MEKGRAIYADPDSQVMVSEECTPLIIDEGSVCLDAVPNIDAVSICRVDDSKRVAVIRWTYG